MVERVAEEGAEDELSYQQEFEAVWGKGDSVTEDETEEEITEEVEEEEATELDDDQVEEEESDDTEDPEDPDAWIKALPDEVKERAEALKHSAASHQGRAVAFQRQLGELTRELELARAARPSAPADKSGAKPTTPASAASELPEEWKKLQEDFPEFAAAVESVRKLDREQYEARLTEVVSPLEQQRLALQRNAFNDAVTAGAKEIFNTDDPEWEWQAVAHSEDFLAWLGMQPQSVKNAARVPDPQEALYVLQRYKQDYDAEVQKLGLGEPTEQEKANATAQADEILQRRVKRKNTSVTPPSKQAAKPQGNVSGDYKAMFDAQWG